MEQDTTEELLAERDEKIRQLEETIKMLTQRLDTVEMDNPEQETALES